MSNFFNLLSNYSEGISCIVFESVFLIYILALLMQIAIIVATVNLATSTDRSGFGWGVFAFFTSFFALSILLAGVSSEAPSKYNALKRYASVLSKETAEELSHEISKLEERIKELENKLDNK